VSEDFRRAPTLNKRLPSPITHLLDAAKQGDVAARERLWALIYEELRAVAQHQLAAEPVVNRRQPTSLVHEAYLRLTAGEEAAWANRRHFFAAAAQAMRRIRIDDARKRKRLKRGGGLAHRLDNGATGSAGGGTGYYEPAAHKADPVEILAVDEALKQLEIRDPRKSEVVMLRYFAGFTVEECADAMDLSPRTIRNEWRFARAWLHTILSGGNHTPKRESE